MEGRTQAENESDGDLSSVWTMLFLEFMTGFVFFQLRCRSAICILGGLGMWRDCQVVGRWLLFVFGEVWIDFEHFSFMVLRPKALNGASLQDQAVRPDGRTCLRVSLWLIGLIIVLIGLDGQNCRSSWRWCPSPNCSIHMTFDCMGIGRIRTSAQHCRWAVQT